MTEGRSAARRCWILVTKPLVLAGWRWRDRRRFRRNNPVEWRSPGEIIALDLENYEEEDGFRLDKAMVEDLLPARDAALARSDRLTIMGMLIFAFLVADYLSINIKIAIPGVDISDVKGVREFLIFFSGLLTTLSLLAQNNQYILDSTIKYIVETRYPEQLRQIYISKYFWMHNFPRYFPVSLPHLTLTRAQSRLGDFISYGWLAALFVYMCLFFGLSLAISWDVWNSPGLGRFSQVIASGAIANSMLCWGYIMITRFKMPYRNYVKIQEVQVLEQIAPGQVEAKRQALYADGNADYFSLVFRGYLTGDQDRDFTHFREKTTPFRIWLIGLLSMIVILWDF